MQQEASRHKVSAKVIVNPCQTYYRTIINNYSNRIAYLSSTAVRGRTHRVNLIYKTMAVVKYEN